MGFSFRMIRELSPKAQAAEMRAAHAVDTGLCPVCRKRVRVSDLDAYWDRVVTAHENRRGKACVGYTKDPIAGSQKRVARK